MANKEVKTQPKLFRKASLPWLPPALGQALRPSELRPALARVLGEGSGCHALKRPAQLDVLLLPVGLPAAPEILCRALLMLSTLGAPACAADCLDSSSSRILADEREGLVKFSFLPNESPRRPTSNRCLRDSLALFCRPDLFRMSLICEAEVSLASN